MSLHISKELTLPNDAATQKAAWLGTTGSGKTYGAMKAAEQMWKEGIQFVALDTMGIWWGLRLDKDGKTPGLEIVVFGGSHGDLPIRPTDGRLIAEVIVREGISAVIDMSDFETDADKCRFASDFADRLYRLKTKSPSAIHAFLEEAHEFVPQNVQGGEAQMLHHFNRLWKQGRNFGIGGSLISQRPQDVNKKCLEMSAAFFCFNVIGVNALDAIKKQIPGPEAAGLPSLKPGNCLVYSPSWLEITQLIKIGEKDTLHVSFDPHSPGAIDMAERTLAPVAIDALREALTATIEQVEADDPKALRKRIAELEKWQGVPNEAEIAREVAIAVAPRDKRIQELEFLLGETSQIVQRLNSILQIEKIVGESAAEERSLEIPAEFKAPPVAPARKPRPEGITSTQQRILDAIAFFESIGNPNPSNNQVGAVALIDSSGGHFSNVVGPLSSNGLVIRSGGRMSLTDEGRAIAQAPEKTPTLAEYHDVLRARVVKAKSASRRTVDILNVVIRRSGKPVSVEDAGREVGIDHTGGHFSNTVGPLSTLGLIERKAGQIHPTALLFPEGLR